MTRPARASVLRQYLVEEYWISDLSYPRVDFLVQIVADVRGVNLNCSPYVISLIWVALRGMFGTSTDRGGIYILDTEKSECYKADRAESEREPKERESEL